MAVVYRIRIGSQLESYREHSFEGMALINLENGEAELEGPVNDQESLFSIIQQIRDLNIPLIFIDCREDFLRHDEERKASMTQQVVALRVKGLSDWEWISPFEEIEIIPLEFDEFLLRTIIIDQPALHGLLKRVHDEKLCLLAMRITRNCQT